MCNKLETSEYKFVWASPKRPNIYYKILPHFDIDTNVKPIVDELHHNKLQMTCVLVYCRSLNVCSDLYTFFLSYLGEDNYFPSGAPKISDNRLFGLYHANTPATKEVIRNSMQKELYM